MTRIPAPVANRILMGEGPIRAWRELLNLNLSTIVKRTRIEQERLLALEQGQASPTPSELDGLSAAFGVPKEHLMVPRDAT